MFTTRILALATTLLLFSAFTVSIPPTWTIDKDYAIKFDTKKAAGSFGAFSGNIVFDENDLAASSVDVQIQVASIKTGNWLKNRHARGDSWLDADQYPTIVFTSEQFAKTDSGYQVTGTLFMHGVQQQLTMPFTFAGNIFKSTFTVDRRDYNIGGTSGMAGTVGYDLSIDIAVPVSRTL